jgi:hypothetical protein
MSTELRKNLVGKYIQAPLSDTLKESIESGPDATESNSKAYSFYGIQTYNPLYDYIWRSHSNQSGQWYGTEWRISKYASNKSFIEKSAGGHIKEAACFRKVVHLLDPMSIIEDCYTFPKTPGLPWHTYSTYAAFNKIQSPHNQAYVDSFGSYLASRLREENISPHFALHYGSLVCMSKKYLYNITDDFQSYKNEKWFWDGIKLKNIKFHILDSSGQTITDPLLLNDIIVQPSTNEVVEEIELTADNIIVEDTLLTEIDDIPDNNININIKSKTVNEEDEEDEEDDDEDDEKINIYLEFNDMPIMMSFYEKQEGCMEDLLYDNDEVGADQGSNMWEERWTAWIFQIIVALSQLQSIYNMTHNDLHTNNILWSKTDKEFLYYRTQTKQIYKVPTYGKIFRIIDFGRAIYDINDKIMISDDYLPGNDADGMYNFGPIFDPDLDLIEPNPSFDLSRLAVSCLEALFPKFPKRSNGKPKIMSKEEGRTMYETTSQLFNLIWSWLVTDDGENILLDKDNNEKYPSFELYINIAEQIHNAIPSKQINKPIFNKYKWNKNISGNHIIYQI